MSCGCVKGTAGAPSPKEYPECPDCTARIKRRYKRHERMGARLRDLTEKFQELSALVREARPIFEQRLAELSGLDTDHEAYEWLQRAEALLPGDPDA